MSYVEHPRDGSDSWVSEFNTESGRGKYDMIDTMVYSKNKCCETCAFFLPMDERDEDGLCLKNVANDLSGQYILGSDTFYCSYHKLKFNNE